MSCLGNANNKIQFGLAFWIAAQMEYGRVCRSEIRFIARNFKYVTEYYG
jgi:hypothetical protein